jgi:hypothetical protein
MRAQGVSASAIRASFESCSKHHVPSIMYHLVQAIPTSFSRWKIGEPSRRHLQRPGGGRLQRPEGGVSAVLSS